MKLAELKNKKTAIWGFGVEGQATAEYLSKHNIGFTVLCSESEAIDCYDCMTNTVTLDTINGYDVVIKSPGISAYADLVQNCTAQIISPTSLWFANESHSNVIAITGTKGKSTTVSLLAHIIKHCGHSVNLVGNIGQALVASHTEYDYIVLEASSFQIYDGNIKARIALITNLYPEHVDWHNGEENYFNDKLKILDHAKTKIINAENKLLTSKTKDKANLYFNDQEGFNVDSDSLYYKQKEILKSTDIQLIGKHNLENIGAALTVCVCLGFDLMTCVEAIKLFSPLEHRLQNLGKIGQHYAINDSIATTPIATLAAMKVVNLSKTTLLVGGYDRGNDWSDFAQALNDNPPNRLLISGENGPAIYNHLKQINATFQYKLFKSLAEALNDAQLNTPKNHTLLLSPGAPSFDQFDSYIKRGEFFYKELKKHAA